MLRHVPRSAVMDPFQLAPSEGELELDIHRRLGVVRQLVVRMQPDLVLAESEFLLVEIPAFLPPVFPPFHGSFIRTKEFHFHLRELAGPESEHAGRDLVAECLADLRDAERQLLSRGDPDQIEVQKDRLAALGPQIRDMLFVEHRPHVRLHHQIELARRRQIFRPAVAARGGIRHLVHAETRLAVPAVAHDVAEPVHMSRRLPGLRMADDGGIEPDHVVPGLHHFVPPKGFHRLFQHGSVGTVVPEPVESAVYFGTLENESAALAQRHDLFHKLAFRVDIHYLTPDGICLFYSNLSNIPAGEENAILFFALQRFFREQRADQKGFQAKTRDRSRMQKRRAIRLTPRSRSSPDSEADRWRIRVRRQSNTRRAGARPPLPAAP